MYFNIKGYCHPRFHVKILNNEKDFRLREKETFFFTHPLESSSRFKKKNLETNMRIREHQMETNVS